jgi:thiol-disulfide isomerase/thioredoxin
MTLEVPETIAKAETEPSRQRRGLMLGAAALAVAAGAGVSWWRRGATVGTVSGPVAEPVPGFWSLQWETPTGALLTAQSLQGKPVLLNFWATWCPPCVEELPLINGFFNANKAAGWHVVGLAIDKKSAVDPFLQKNPLDFPVALAGLSGADLGRALGNLTGSLPFTVIIGSDGAVLHRKMGRVSPEDLSAWAALK